jgi:cytochrome b subunit of formate dehydrogenase
MARFATFLILVAAFAWAGHAIKAGRGSVSSSIRRLGTDARASLERLRSFRGIHAADLVVSLRVLLYFLAAVAVVVLATTGFLPYWIWGPHASGFSLVLHVAAAPVFAVCMTALTLLWAHRLRLDSVDLARLSRTAADSQGEETADTRPGATATANKLTFWALVLLSPLVMGSIILRMYPVFSTPGHQALLSLHLVSGLLFVLVAVIQVVLLVNSSAK